MEPKHNKKSVAGIMKESKSTLQSLYNITNHMSPTPIGHFLSTYIRFIFFVAIVLTARACYRKQMQTQHLLKEIVTQKILLSLG